MKHRRLVALVDDAHRHEQLAGADVEPPVDQEVEVGLFELELAFVFTAFDNRVLELQLRDEPNPVRESMREEQHETAEVERAVRVLGLVELKVHVPGQGTGTRAAGRGSGLGGGGDG